MAMVHIRLGRSGVAAVVIGVVVAFAVAVFVGLSFSSSSRLRTFGAGSEAPAWSGTSLSGTHLTSATERGRWVVLNFFATWCTDCRVETPALEAFATAHSAGGVEVVAVLHADSVADARSFAAAHHVTFPILVAGQGAIPAAYHLADALPETFVISPDGRIADQLAGAVTAAQLDRIVTR